MKLFFSLLICFALALTCTAQVPSYVPSDGLVGWYPFNGSALNSTDLSEVVSVNGPELSEDRYGAAASAFYFDGIDDDIITSNVGVEGRGITLSFWYKTEQVAQNAYMVAYGGNSWGTYFEILNNHWSAQTPGPCYSPALTGGGTLISRGSDAFPDPNSWHHTLVILPEAAQSLSDAKFYFDGEEQPETCSFANYGAPQPFISNANPMKFGSSYQEGSWTNSFEGFLDDVGIWNRSLSPEEIEALFQSQENAGVDGCTDETACNYNPEATEDDGSCINADVVVDDSQLCETGVVDMSVFQNDVEGEPRSLNFSQGQYVRIPMSSSLSNFTDYTMEFWYFETGGHGSDEMIVGTEFFAGNRYGIYSFVDGYWPYIRDNSTFLGLGYNGTNPGAGISYNMNEWNHIAITYDGSTFRFFVNGQLSYSESGSVSGFGPLTEDLVINRHTWATGSSSRLAGQLDELRISDIARYTSNFSPPEYEFQNDLNTKGLWHFNEGSGGAVYDASPFGNHGNCLGTGWSENTPITQSLTEGYDVFWNDSTESTPTYEASPGETVEVVLVGELGSCSEVINVGVYDLDEGCADEDACNYSETAACNLGCVYPVLGAGDCDEGSVTCGPGTTWDAELQLCLPEMECDSLYNPDVDFDGFIGLTDLLAILSHYNNEWPPWECGDPLEYQGYDYETVQIGEQCWFAENLKVENYRNGDAIMQVNEASTWQSLSQGGRRIYGLGDMNCGVEGDTIGLCSQSSAEVLNFGGYLYNWYVVAEGSNVCPNGWHAPDNDAFDELLEHAENLSAGLSGLKSTEGWVEGSEGSNQTGFRAIGSGYGGNLGNFASDGHFTGFWSANASSGTNAHHLQIDERPNSAPTGGVFINGNNKKYALSIRCIKDTEQ